MQGTEGSHKPIWGLHSKWSPWRASSTVTSPALSAALRIATDSFHPSLINWKPWTTMYREKTMCFSQISWPKFSHDGIFPIGKKMAVLGNRWARWGWGMVCKWLVVGSNPEGPNPEIWFWSHRRAWNRFGGGACDLSRMTGTCQVPSILLGGRGDCGFNPFSPLPCALCCLLPAHWPGNQQWPRPIGPVLGLISPRSGPSKSGGGGRGMGGRTDPLAGRFWDFPCKPSYCASSSAVLVPCIYIYQAWVFMFLKHIYVAHFEA